MKKGEIIMKYSEATKAIQGLNKEYSIYNNRSAFEVIYKSQPTAWVDKIEQFNFGQYNTLAPEFAKMPHSHKLYMILAELAMTPISEREEHKWNVIVGNDSSEDKNIVCWIKSDGDSHFPYLLCLSESYSLTYDDSTFTDEEFSDLIKYIKMLPDGEWQAKVAEHGKTEVKIEDGEEKIESVKEDK